MYKENNSAFHLYGALQAKQTNMSIFEYPVRWMSPTAGGQPQRPNLKYFILIATVLEKIQREVRFYTFYVNTMQTS